MPRSRVNGVVVGRGTRSIVVEHGRTKDRIVIGDLTGDVELLLELLADGYDCAAAVDTLVAHRDGLSQATVWSTMTELAALDLVERPEHHAADGDDSAPRSSADRRLSHGRHARVCGCV